jgi:1,4-alpha-glucan branching enzyme
MKLTGIRTIIALSLCGIPVQSFSQLPAAISIDPPDATAWEQMTLTYDPSKGCTPSGKGSLVGSSVIKMHSACFYLENIDAWPSWGQTTIDYDAVPKDGVHATTDLTPNGNGTYSITFVPGAFYGAPGGKPIIGLTMVFNNGSWNNEGKDFASSGCKDFFVPLNYVVGLFVQITEPSSNSFFTLMNDTIPVSAEANNSNTIELYLDDILVSSTVNSTLVDSIIVTEPGEHWIKVLAYDDESVVGDSASYYVRDSNNIAEIPTGSKEGINYIDTSKINLVLLAPGKEFVYVIGDFNDWTIKNDYLMNQTPDGGYFWIEIDSLIKGKEYAYQYLVDGEIRIGDPYAEKVLDPSNDPWINEETYPGLIQYPVGKTTDIVTVLQTNQADFEWAVTDFNPPEVEDMVIYELLIRDFTARHTFQALIDTLTYLIDLGINVIELMPVNEFEGNLSWGYNPSYYFATDKYYGPSTDLKRFIDICHQHGIAVVLDMVLNHSFGQSPMVKMYWDSENQRPAADNPWFNQVPKHDYNVGYDMNHESIYTKRFFVNVVRFWLQKYNVDGFRFDLSKGFTQKNTLGNTEAWGQYDISRINIWKSYSDSIWKTNPKTRIILEHFAENSEEQVLTSYGMLVWGNLNYNYSRAGMGWNYEGKSDFTWGSYKARGFTAPNLVTYMESHDEERQMRGILDWGNNKNPNYIVRNNLPISLVRAELSAAFFFTIPGPKMIWQFEELGYDYSINYGCRTCEKPIRWDYFEQPERQRLYQVFSELIKLKKDYEAFSSTDFTIDVSDTLKTIHIKHPSMDVVIAGNFDTWPRTIEPVFTKTGKWYDYFSGDSLAVTNINMSLGFDKSEYRIYTSVKIPRPEMITAPQVTDVSINGNIALGEILYGNYTYFDLNGDPEGTSLFQWYKGLYEDGAAQTAIYGANEQNYQITPSDWGYWLFFEVTPVAESGFLIQGIPGYGSIDVATEIDGNVYPEDLLIFPNPSNGIFNIKINYTGNQIIHIQIIDLFGKLVCNEVIQDHPDSEFEFRWNGKDQLDNILPQGMYLLKLQSGNFEYTRKLILIRD